MRLMGLATFIVMTAVALGCENAADQRGDSAGSHAVPKGDAAASNNHASDNHASTTENNNMTTPANNTSTQAATNHDDAADEQAARKAVFAGGCFWCTEAVFEQIDGVSDVVSGYAGDTQEKANYQLVVLGVTNHAEAIEITYDPKKVSYEQLLDIFFATHDPTTLNRQGPDTGRQYRSAVFYANDEEKAAAENMIEQLNASGKYSSKIVTTLEPLTGFYPAEQYHQDFAERNPYNPYIRQQAAPKVEKTKEQFSDLLRKD